MSKEIVKLNSVKKFKEITNTKKEKTPAPVVEQPLWEDKVAAFLENKVGGAVKEVFRRKELDENVELSLSDGLETNPEFVKQSKKIDKKRNWLVTTIEKLLKKKGKKEVPTFVFDEAAEKAMRELEQELTDSFSKDIYGRLGEMNKRILLDHLVDKPVNRTSSKIIELPNVSEAYNNVYAFSDNGYLMQLANKEEVRDGQNIKVNGEEALYNLIAPDGRLISQNLKFQEALDDMEAEANLYQEQINEEFTRQEIVNKNLADREKELNRAELENTNENEVEMNKLMDDLLEDEKDIARQSQKEKDFSAHPEKWSEQTEKSELVLIDSEPENKIEEKPELIILEVEGGNLENKEEQTFNNPFTEKISRYAESIGIKSEELANNYDFLSLSPEQQQFALETLRRTSLAKARVEGYQNFTKEKATKKWWQVGFVMNQNYHKERHKMEAVQNIEKNGLAGYGETELNWLVNVIKNGPEIQVNEKGEVVLNFLKENNFTEEQKELVAKYNETARGLLVKNTQEEKIRFDLDDLQSKIMNTAQTYGEKDDLERMMFNAQNNIELIKFLSANKETEEVLNKMSKTSLNGLDRFKGMLSGQKDKMGYSALGFALRTGSNLAMANSAYLASALTYSTAPIVAAIVGAFRGYNNGRKELTEKEELAQLGIEDQSGLTNKLNLVTGKKETENGEVNFGLTEKLEKLSSKLEQAYYNSSSEDISKLKESLMLRISFTERKIDTEQINYGSVEERNANYFKLLEAISRAKSLVGMSPSHFSDYKDQVDFDQNLTRYEGKTKFLDKGYDESDLAYKERLASYKKQENESEQDYKKRVPKEIREYQLWATDQKRLSELSKISVEDRLASFLNLQEDKQSNKERKFLIKKTATGALMGAGFAAAGQFLAEHLHAADWFQKGSIKPVDKEAVAASLKIESDESVASVESTDINTESAPVDEVVEKTTTEVVIEKPTSISDVKASHISEQRENLVVEKIEVKPIEVKEIEIPNKIIETDNNIKTEDLSGGEASENYLDGENNIESSEADLEIDSSLPESPENQIVDPVVETPIITNPNTIPEVVTETPNVPDSNISEVVSENASSEDVVDQEVLDGRAAANFVKSSIEYDNRAATLSDGLYSGRNGFKTEEDFLGKIEEMNKVKLTPQEKTEVQSIFKSFKNNNDYNILRRRLVSFENNLLNKAVSSSATENLNNVGVQVENLTPNVNEAAAVNTELANQFHVKPESINQIGENIFYKAGDNSNLVIDAKSGIIKEAVDAKGAKVSSEFIKETMGKKSLAKFSRQDGLEKLFSSWNKLGTDDKLIYNSLDWFNKKTMSPEDLVGQIKGLYQVDTKNISIDSVNNKFVSSDGREFDLTIKGIKKMVAYLKK